jgi:hypothetical protein
MKNNGRHGLFVGADLMRGIPPQPACPEMAPIATKPAQTDAMESIQRRPPPLDCPEVNCDSSLPLELAPPQAKFDDEEEGDYSPRYGWASHLGGYRQPS